MFLQTGGGGKGIRPNQQHQQQQQQQQQQQHHHQSHLQSHHQPHHTHTQQQQQQQQQQQPPQSVHHGHPQQQTLSHHPHQSAQQQHQQQQQQQQQQQHHHPPPPPQLSYYPYQLSQAPPPPPQSIPAQHAQQQQASNNVAQGGTQMAPSPPTQVSSSITSSIQQQQTHGHGLGAGGGSVGGNSANATNIARQHAVATSIGAGNVATNLQHYTATSAALMQPPPTNATFMTPAYLQQYHQQSAAAIAAAAAAYNSNVAAAAAAAAAAGGGPGNSQNTASLYQQQQQQQQQQQHHQSLHHPQSLHTHYYHATPGATPTPPPHLHSHHHPQQHQLRGVLTAPPHQRPHQPQPQTYLQIFALPSGPLAAAPRTSLLPGAHQQGGATGTSMSMGPMRGTAGGPTPYITPPFCQPPMPIGAAGLAPAPSLLATAASMQTPTLQTYGHLTGVTAATNSSSSATSLTGGPNSGLGSGGVGSTSGVGTTDKVKVRKHAIPIVHPITLETVDLNPQKKSAAVEVKPAITITPTLAPVDEVPEQQNASTTTLIATSGIIVVESPTESGDKSVTVSFSKAAVAAGGSGGVFATASKEKIDQQMQTDAVRDKNKTPSSAGSNVAAYDAIANDASPTTSTTSGCEDIEGGYTSSGDLTTPRSGRDLDSDVGIEDEQITVVFEESDAASANTAASDGQIEDDVGEDSSNYDEVESTSLVDVPNDQEDEPLSVEYEETKQIQDKAQQQQDFTAKTYNQQLQKRDAQQMMIPTRYESIGTTTSGLGAAPAGGRQNNSQDAKTILPQRQQHQQQQKHTITSMPPVVQMAQRPKSNQNNASNFSAILSTTTVATATPNKAQQNLRSTKSTGTGTMSTTFTSTAAGAATAKSSTQQQTKSSPTTSGASSSAASTPTHHHQQHQQSQQRKSSTITASSNIAASTVPSAGAPAAAAAATSSSNSASTSSSSTVAATAAVAASNTKKNRKATKRAKESQKKLKQNESNNRSHSSSSSNNNSNNFNNNKNMNSNSSNLSAASAAAAATANSININNNNVQQAASAAAAAATMAVATTPTKTMTDINNANNCSGNSSNINTSKNSSNLREIQAATVAAANLKQQQQQHFRGQANNNSSSSNKSGGNSSRGVLSKATDFKCDPLAENPTFIAGRTVLPAQQQHQQQQQQPKTPEEQPLQFLNSSSSACEDDEEINARLQLQLQQDAATAAASSTATEDLRFGDFVEDNTEMIGGAGGGGGPVTRTNSSNKTTGRSANMDTVDCSVAGSSKVLNPMKMSKPFGSSVGATGSSFAPTATIVAAELKSSPTVAPPRPERIKYTLDELKSFAKSSEARKPPMVRCQKGDCIAQLFVSKHHMSHHGHNMPIAMHPHLQQQQYQHMNFNESLELVSGKRRGGGQAKKHHDHQAGSSGGGGGGAIGGVIGGSGAGGGGNSAQRKMEIIRVQLSLKEEIKLSECENAWQPETLRNNVCSSSSSSPTAGQNDDMEALLKKVRGVLNKLTPFNFDVLLKTMTSISMNTQEKMQQVMLLIFEKTVSEPNFAPTYAKFCKVLFQEIKAESKSLFTNSLITRIQHEFEMHVNDADAKKKKLQPLVDKLETCVDPKECLELQAEIEDQEYQFRRRAWGTVRFIGEMYRLQSLTCDRVLICIESLLEHGCEEKLEYMCKLLQTVGHMLEEAEHNNSNVRMDNIFRKIQEIVKNSRSSSTSSHGHANSKGGGHQPKISSRVRFMMQDVIDLRASSWNQTQEQQQQQQQNQQLHRRNASASKQDDKMLGGGGGGGNSGSGGSGGGGSGGIYEKNSNRMTYGNQSSQRQARGGNNESGGGGSSSYFLNKSQKSQFMQQQEQQKVNIDVNKLQFSRGDATTNKLGPSLLSMWRTPNARQPASGGGGLGASSMSAAATTTDEAFSGNTLTAASMMLSASGLNVATAVAQQQRNNAANKSGGGFKRQQTSNQYHVLEKSDKPLQRTQNACTTTGGNASIASSSSCNSSKNGEDDDDEPTVAHNDINIDLEGGACSSVVATSSPSLTPKECQKILNRLIEECLDTSTSGGNWQQEAQRAWRSITPKQQVSLLHYLLMDYLHLAFVKRPQRKACAQIFTHLMRTQACGKQVFAEAYGQLVDEFPDLLVDVPNGWSYVFEFIGPMLHEHLLHFGDVWLPQWMEDTYFTERFLRSMITYFTSEFGANYTRDLWHKEFKLNHGQAFMEDQEQWHDFIQANGFQFIYERNCKPPQQQQYERQQQHHGSGICSNMTASASTAEQVERIEFLLNTVSGCDLAIDYIHTNVNININFIRNLTKFLCCDYATVMTSSSSMAQKMPTKTTAAASTCGRNTTTGAASSQANNASSAAATTTSRQLNSELFRSKCTPLLRLCIDGHEQLEITCLDAIVDSLQQLYDIDTANELVSNIFDTLYDSEVIPKESFDKWYKGISSLNDDDSEGISPTASATSTTFSGNDMAGVAVPVDTNVDNGRTGNLARKQQTMQTQINNNSNRDGNNIRLSHGLHAYMKKLL